MYVRRYWNTLKNNLKSLWLNATKVVSHLDKVTYGLG